MVIARQTLGDVLRSEPQTLQLSLNFSKCHFCKYQSTIGDKVQREKLGYIHTLSYVVTYRSSGFFSSRLQCKSPRAIVWLIACCVKVEWGTIRCWKK